MLAVMMDIWLFLLGAAKMLMSMKDRIEGDVYLAFQPAEETGAGAPDFIKFGDWYDKVGAIFGGHVWIDLPAGLVSVEEGPRMAASSQITINVKRKTRSWCTATPGGRCYRGG